MSYATKNQLKAFAQAIKEKFAKKHDPDAVAGYADQLITTVGVTDKVPYNFRTSGGSADIGNRLNDKIVGGTICWNQLVKDAKINIPIGSYSYASYDNGYTFINGHKYALLVDNTELLARMRVIGTSFASAGKTENIISYTEETGSGDNYMIQLNGTSTKVSHVRFHDLTQMFGSTVADYVYSLEQATAGAGVAWFKNLFQKTYYANNAGELMSVCTNAHITRGFNALDEEWELGDIAYQSGGNIASTSWIRSKNFCRILGGNNYYFKSNDLINVFLYDSEKNYLGMTTGGLYQQIRNTEKNIPVNASYFKCAVQLTTYNHDICINLSHSGYRNGEYEPYVEHVYPLSSIELHGIPKIADGKLYFDGDTYAHDGTVMRKFTKIVFGTTGFARTPHPAMSGVYVFTRTMTTPNTLLSIMQKYVQSTSSQLANKTYFFSSTYFGASVLAIRDDSFDNATDFMNALDGTEFVTMAMNITTETADPFADPQIVDDFGTEEYVDALATAETAPRDVAIPVGHETFYQANLRDKLQRLPAMPQAPGDYIVRFDGTKCVFVPLPQQND